MGQINDKVRKTVNELAKLYRDQLAATSKQLEEAESRAGLYREVLETLLWNLGREKPMVEQLRHLIRQTLEISEE